MQYYSSYWETGSFFNLPLARTHTHTHHIYMLTTYIKALITGQPDQLALQDVEAGLHCLLLSVKLRTANEQEDRKVHITT